MRALRSIAAVLAGFIAASLVMMLVESINGRILYPELARAAAGVKDREAMRALFAAAPAGALLVVIGGWTLGSLLGGWLAARLAGRATTGHALTVGGLLLLAGLANNLMLPPPTWFWILSLAVFLPAAYAGSRLAPAR
jgi:hypothetical protein